MTEHAALEVRAPNRIDLAGGTLDLYPLYLFEEKGLTLNAAISVYSHVTLQPLEDSQVVLQSFDRDETVAVSGVDALDCDGPLGLLARAVRHYRPEGGVKVQTRNEAPQGSGLGASSALLMALSVGLVRLNGSELQHTKCIDVGADLEAQVIKIPTGKQDYYSALYGGVSALWFGVGGHEREALCASEEDRTVLEEHFILSFTGVSHFSGASNWEMLRNYVDGNEQTRSAMRRIGSTARELYGCLREEALSELPRIIGEEWRNRRELAAGVTTPEIDAMIAAAEEAGAGASKLCGAGGGGCMITYVEPVHRASVASALEGAGAEIIPFTIDTHGVTVQEFAST